MTTCELRLKAADEMEKRGRCTHRLMSTTGAVCLIGSLYVAAGFKLTRDTVTETATKKRNVQKACKAMGFKNVRHAIDWNDLRANYADTIKRLRDGCTPPAEAR